MKYNTQGTILWDRWVFMSIDGRCI